MAGEKLPKAVADVLKGSKRFDCFLIALIVLLIAVCWLWNGKSSDGGGSGIGAMFSSSASHSDIELRMAKTLCAIKGAGRVEVMITHEAEPLHSSGDWLTAGTSAQGGQTVKGAIIVAQGAKDVAVRLNLLKAAQTLLNIPAAKIEIFEMAMQ